MPSRARAGCACSGGGAARVLGLLAAFSTALFPLMIAIVPAMSMTASPWS